MGTNDFTEEEKQSIKKIEQLLYRYPTTQQRINKLEIDIEIIEHDYETLHGQSNNHIKASTMTNETHDLSDFMEQKEKKIRAIKDEIFKEKITAKMIENALGSLKEDDKIFIKEKYFDTLGETEMARIHYCSRGNVYARSRVIVRDKIKPYINSLK